MAKRISKPVTKNKKDDTVLFAFLATFLSIIGFVIALAAKRDNKYVMFYAKQSLIVFIAGCIAAIIAKIFSLIPIIGTIIAVALNIIVFIAWLLSWIYSLSGRETEVPVIGEFAKYFNF